MDTTILLSESFDRAAYALRDSMDLFRERVTIGEDVSRFERAAESFRCSVDKLTTVLGMQSENDQRKAAGSSMAYTEEDFANV